MGMLDNLGNFTGSTGQALTGTSDQTSTNVIDMGGAVKLFGGSYGKGPKVSGLVSAVGGTNPTFRARLVAADSADLATNPIILVDTGASRALVAGDIPYLFTLSPSEQLDAKRYYGVIFTQGGTSPTATAFANLALDVQDNLVR